MPELVEPRDDAPWLIDVEQEPAKIRELFERHNQPIPDYQPGDWVGVDLDTMKPVVITDVSAYDALPISLGGAA